MRRGAKGRVKLPVRTFKMNSSGGIVVGMYVCDNTHTRQATPVGYRLMGPFDLQLYILYGWLMLLFFFFFTYPSRPSISSSTLLFLLKYDPIDASSHPVPTLFFPPSHSPPLPTNQISRRRPWLTQGKIKLLWRRGRSHFVYVCVRVCVLPCSHGTRCCPSCPESQLHTQTHT